MDKKLWEQMIAAQKGGMCNMLDRQCLSDVYNIEITKPQLMEYMTDYEELEKKFS